MDTSKIDYGDIQGLVRFGHGRLEGACFLMLRVESAEPARSWLANTAVTTAVESDSLPEAALQVAFTSQGLRALRVPEDIIAGFSPEFICGMAEKDRSRRLGDIAANEPGNWNWGGPGNMPDVMLMLYTSLADLEGRKKTLIAKLPGAGFRLLTCLDTENLNGIEPFGFKDGVSQPAIDWDRTRKLDGADQVEYGNLIALGEFLLGYPNEYGKYTDRPLVGPQMDPSGALPQAEDQPGKRDLGRNGTYLVFRQLRQEVRSFWQFLDKQAGSDPKARRDLAESFVGRTMSGDPLVPLSTGSIPGVEDTQANQFTFTSDQAGTRCPLGAHIRRANPRNADLPEGATGLISRLIRILGFGGTGFRYDILASTRFHRILRRGREYGPGLSQDDALQPAPPDDGERGLHFICLNANISRQFEFAQSSWIMSAKFDGLSEESDPLLGNREPVDGCPVPNTFTLPQENGLRRRITGVPQFVTVRGGAYFFLPGVRALRYIATIGTSSPS